MRAACDDQSSGRTGTTAGQPTTKPVTPFETGTETETLETSASTADVAAPALRDELLEMMRADQVERTGDGLPPGTKLPPIQDGARATRLKETSPSTGGPLMTLSVETAVRRHGS